NDKISRTQTKRQTGFQNRKAHSLTALFYSKEFRNVYKSWGLTEETHLCKASIDGPQSLLSRKCRTNSSRIKPIEESVPSSCGICTIKPINVLDSTTQTVALVTHQGRGHRSPAPPAAHPLQLEVASQSLQPVDAVAIYALAQ
ncbi:MAG: hypothetical protein VXY89_16865, partial [SAR324 cluster bacterium]|nr:hypothetical protein [SAR324 cluster bacterium]